MTTRAKRWGIQRQQSKPEEVFFRSFTRVKDELELKIETGNCSIWAQIDSNNGKRTENGEQREEKKQSSSLVQHNRVQKLTCSQKVHVSRSLLSLFFVGFVQHGKNLWVKFDHWLKWATTFAVNMWHNQWTRPNCIRNTSNVSKINHDCWNIFTVFVVEARSKAKKLQSQSQWKLSNRCRLSSSFSANKLSKWAG